MPAVRRLIPVIALSVAAVSFAVAPAAGSDRPTPARFDVQTRTVQLSDVSAGTPYASFTVPDCVTEIAYVMDGAAGGSSRRVGTNAYAPGGQGAVLSGTVRVSAGEQIRLYPSQQGVSAQLNSDTGDAGGGGTIGFRAGGGGTGKDDGWMTRSNAGGGGGASSALTIGSTPLVVAAGGGGAGGSSWNSAVNTGRGGAGDARGADGVINPGSGGALNSVIGGAGGKATEPSLSGGGGGGGGAGYVGGGGGRGGTSASLGGGGGAGGTSFVEAARAGTTSVTEFGLQASDVTPSGDGAVKIAWYGCASVLTLEGTATSADGTSTASSGWAHRLTTSATLRPGSDLVLDTQGRADATLRGFATASSTLPVTVSQAPRQGWVMRDWSAGAMHIPPATCTVNGDPAAILPVTRVDGFSFRVDIPADTWVRCTFDSVEGAPSMTVTSDTYDVENDLTDPTTVISGTGVRFGYTVRNTGNLPLDLTVADPKTPDLACVTTALLPGAETRCTGSTSITRDQDTRPASPPTR